MATGNQTTGPFQTKKLLQALEMSRDLKSLDRELGKFNVFAAIGAVWRELRHSDFLAFLLDPKQNHGLGDALAKKLLQKVSVSSPTARMPVTSNDLRIWRLDETEVYRESEHMDILLVLQQARFF